MLKAQRNMNYITKWIEGEKSLGEFCLKRFGQTPRFIENIGHAGDATIHKRYKWREDRQEYAQMFFLFMKHPKGTVVWTDAEEQKTYEEIRLCKGSVLDV